MQKLRFLTVGLGALALAAVSAAQFDGPAPLAWRFIQSTRVAPGGTPLVYNERVYQSIGGRVYCVDLETGNLKFRFPSVDPIPGSFRSAPVRTTSNVIVAAGDNKLIYGFDGNTGDLKWSFPVVSGVYGQPVAVGNYVVIGQSDNKFIAIDATTGEAFWNNPFNVLDGISGSPAVYRNSIIFFNNRNELISLNIATRQIDWKRPLSTVMPNPVPVVYGEDVWVSSGLFLVQISAATGLPRWQAPTNMQLAFSPTVSSSGVLVISTDGKVMVFDPITRTSLTRNPVDIDTQAVMRPIAAGDKFVIPTTAGGVILFDPKLAGGTVTPAANRSADPNVSRVKPPASTAVLWNYLIRPLTGPIVQANQNGPGGGFGGGGGGGFGGGAVGGLGAGGLGGGGLQGNNQNQVKISTVQPSASPVLAGTTLLVPAKDGSLLAFDRKSGVDLTPPKVEMTFPNAGDQLSGQPPLLLVFKISDDASGINDDTVKVEINGASMDYKLQKDGTVVVRFTQTGRNKSLSDGRKEIVVTVKDWLGNEAKQKYALTIDNTLPPIKLTQDPNQQGGGFPGGGGFGGSRGGGGFGGGGRGG